MVLTHLCIAAKKWDIIRIHHECEGGIEKSVSRIADWHHEACRVMTNGDHEGQISFSCSPLNTAFYIRKHEKLQENLDVTEMRHGDVI